jgi:hypothetical protein
MQRVVAPGKGKVMNTLLLVAFVFEALAAFAFIAVPGPALAPLGVALDPSGTSMARLFGAAVLGLAVLLWHAWSSADRALKRVTVRTLVAYWLASAVLMAMTLLGGLMNALGWALVVVHVGLAIWSGAFLRK